MVGTGVVAWIQMDIGEISATKVQVEGLELAVGAKNCNFHPRRLRNQVMKHFLVCAVPAHIFWRILYDKDSELNDEEEKKGLTYPDAAASVVNLCFCIAVSERLVLVMDALNDGCRDVRQLFGCKLAHYLLLFRRYLMPFFQPVYRHRRWLLVEVLLLLGYVIHDHFLEDWVFEVRHGLVDKFFSLRFPEVIVIPLIVGAPENDFRIGCFLDGFVQHSLLHNFA